MYLKIWPPLKIRQKTTVQKQKIHGYTVDEDNKSSSRRNKFPEEVRRQKRYDLTESGKQKATCKRCSALCLRRPVSIRIEDIEKKKRVKSTRAK